jgi:hypothetical protein
LSLLFQNRIAKKNFKATIKQAHTTNI